MTDSKSYDPARPVGSMYDAVARFTYEIIGYPVPITPTVLPVDYGNGRADFLQEELNEFRQAINEQDLDKAVDAMIDLVYVALGNVIQMGVPPGPAFDEVQAANMRKKRGGLSKRPGIAQHDAVKPPGWKAPDHSWLLDVTSDHVELLEKCARHQLDPRLLASLSPVFLDITRLRRKKGNDYNTGVRLEDYFPFGHLSYAQMAHVKSLRLRSLIEVMLRGGKANFEGLEDSILDNINYLAFWAEAIRRGELATVTPRGEAA